MNEIAKGDGDVPTTKRCSRCGVKKPFEEFNKHAGRRYGLHSWCKACFSEYRSQHYVKKGHYKAKWRVTGIKRCPHCGMEKPIEEFYPAKKGLSSWCRACFKEWRRENAKRSTSGAGRYGFAPRLGMDVRLLTACADWYVENVRPFRGKKTMPAVTRLARYLAENSLSLDDIVVEEHRMRWFPRVGSTLKPPALLITSNGSYGVFAVVGKAGNMANGNES